MSSVAGPDRGCCVGFAVYAERQEANSVSRDVKSAFDYLYNNLFIIIQCHQVSYKPFPRISNNIFSVKMHMIYSSIQASNK